MINVIIIEDEQPAIEKLKKILLESGEIINIVKI